MVLTRLTIGVDVGGTNVRAAIVDTKGRILNRLVEKSDKASGPLGLSRQIARMVHALDPKGRIRRIGVGSAGPLDLKSGAIVGSPHLRYRRIPLVEPLEELLGASVSLVNDCVAAAAAEKMYGRGRGHANLVYVTLSTGIGAGVYVDNRLLSGKDGNAHEVGHITIDHSGALACGCGRRGHWEAYCGGDYTPNFVKYQLKMKSPAEVESSMISRIVGGDLTRLRSEDLFRCAKAGDAIAKAIVKEMGRLNAIGFANVTAAYDPELITVGGAIAIENPSLVIRPIRRWIRDYSINRPPRIEVTRLGEEIVLLGAVALASGREPH
ncbi:MAG: ROK family protein [Candidatus Bathyarchaeia archaeon]